MGEQDIRVQVYMRFKGQTICDGDEFKSELYFDRDELKAAVCEFIDKTWDYMDEGYEDE